MTTATIKPLYLLPFDHRHSYIKGMFHFDPPLSDTQHDHVAASKQLIYDGFKAAVGTGLAQADAGILVDEEFGAALLRDAQARGFVTAVSVEKSGQDDFQFEYGNDFAAHIEAFHPTYAKVLVRYNPAGDAAVNAAQREHLKKLSDYCQRSSCGFMFELLVPATAAQLASVQGDKKAYDVELRCDLMLQAIGQLQDADIEPTLWKIEGLDQRADCERIVAQVQRGGRHHTHCIVLGRGADIAQVEHWLSTAASVPGFIGFAVGRTTFWDAVADVEAQKITRLQGVAHVAERYRRWITIFEQGLRARNDAERVPAIPAASAVHSAGAST
ncbi:2-deoxy-5-keto-D-gluconate 6-phosphate aldolase domain-containing protein [Simplicispira psychrophila]|uniref:2-deoxy-5-keto-D-gluconate 6-phosphate aldolase domain-containing protein n=1 Tax=Simplicispira psychrophila TaxID=80882 RepID=UPI00068F2597|nr:DUF2090 domain-containing protein [Simplicispira psychrophila]